MSDSQPTEIQTLLAIDLGLRCGFAVFEVDGELLAYRSTHFANRKALKDSVWGILKEIDDLAHVVVEGDKALAEIWRKVAEKQGMSFQIVPPEVWRADMLTTNQRADAKTAKETADRLALEIIEKSEAAPAPKGELTNDVCEAILIGAWASALHDTRDS